MRHVWSQMAERPLPSQERPLPTPPRSMSGFLPVARRGSSSGAPDFSLHVV